MKKVLFISHNAGRTGAPLMLLNMLRWFKENTDLSFEILLRGPGSLQNEFAAVAPTCLYQNQEDSSSLIAHAYQRLGFGNLSTKRHHRQLLRSFRASGIELIYANSITNGDILKALAPLGCPVITHVHELEGWIQQAGQENLNQVISSTLHYIAASKACKQNLVEEHGLRPEKIDVVHSFIPVPLKPPCPGSIRKELGISEEAFVILGSGHEGWKKGKDLFAPLAALVNKKLRRKPAHFLWIGGWQSLEERTIISKDLCDLKLVDRVHFVGEVSNPLDYFAAGDVFALVSREDTFPLVCLEAATLEKPILCFFGAGGMPEFVEKDAGFVLPYLDIEAMAEKISLLAEDEALCAKLGVAAKKKVRNLYDIESGSKQILKVISRF